MNTQHRINGHVYVITTTVVDWIDIFTRPAYKHIVLESLSYCIANKGMEVYAWVLMTNHLHLLVGITGENTVSDIMRDFKKFTSKKLIDTLQQEYTESRKEWMLDRFEFSGRNDKKIKNFRFWQEGTDMLSIRICSSRLLRRICDYGCSEDLSRIICNRIWLKFQSFFVYKYCWILNIKNKCLLST